jgi:competence protein ComFC
MQVALKSFFETALSFFYPEVCQLCKEEHASPDAGYIGPKCQKKIKFIEPPYCEICGLPKPGQITNKFTCTFCRDIPRYFSSARAVFAARDVGLDLIHLYKYGRCLWLEPLLGGLLVQHAAPGLHLHQWDFIVPVPLHPQKKAEREFNQAERLARPLSGATQIPLETRSLIRVKPTMSQTTLSREERAANVRDAFELRAGHPFRGKRVVVLDDVLTTCATTNACARVLSDAGADEVCVWTLSRGLLH